MKHTIWLLGSKKRGSAQHNNKRHQPTDTRPNCGAKHTMSNRFSRQDARDDLFSSYNRSASPSKSKNKARASPYSGGGGYAYTAPTSPSGSPGFGAYPGASSHGNGNLYPGGSSGGGSGYGVGRGKDDAMFRSATPNSRGQYSAAVLDELESQNDEHVGVLTSKVRMLKDVCFAPLLSFSPWEGGEIFFSRERIFG